MNNNKITDESIITFGKHNGKRLIDVPANYLIWIHENNKCPGWLKPYIRENMDVLKSQAKQK